MFDVRKVFVTVRRIDRASGPWRDTRSRVIILGYREDDRDPEKSENLDHGRMITVIPKPCCGVRGSVH